MSKAGIHFASPSDQFSPEIASSPTSETTFPLPLRCCLCFQPLQRYENVKKQAKGPALCRLCEKEIRKRAKLNSKILVLERKTEENGVFNGDFDDESMVVSVPSPLPSETTEEITKSDDQNAVSVNCLHCGHTYSSRDALWQHMKTAKLRLLRQTDLEKRCEWLDIATGLLEREFAGPNSLLIVLEPGNDVAERKVTGKMEGFIRDLEGERELCGRQSGNSVLRTGLTEENWYLISEIKGKSPKRRRKRARRDSKPIALSPLPDKHS